MWRSWITRASEPAELVRGRLVAVAFQVKIGPFERVWFASLYATTDSEAARSAQLRAFGSWHGEQSWPVVLGGDFNMDKVDTAAWSPAECVIVSTGPEDFTCFGPDHVSTIDYFMVSRCCSAYVGQTSTQVSGIATHKPVKMVFKVQAHDPIVTTVQAGSRTSAGPVFGPHLEELADSEWQHAYERADGLAAEVRALANGFSLCEDQVQPQHWQEFDGAWNEWLDLTNRRMPSKFGATQVCGEPFEFKQMPLSLAVAKAAKEFDEKAVAIHRLRSFRCHLQQILATKVGMEGRLLSRSTLAAWADLTVRRHGDDAFGALLHLEGASA